MAVMCNARYLCLLKSSPWFSRRCRGFFHHRAPGMRCRRAGGAARRGRAAWAAPPAWWSPEKQCCRHTIVPGLDPRHGLHCINPVMPRDAQSQSGSAVYSYVVLFLGQHNQTLYSLSLSVRLMIPRRAPSRCPRHLTARGSLRGDRWYGSWG
jgi:hypothetical protein